MITASGEQMPENQQGMGGLLSCIFLPPATEPSFSQCLGYRICLYVQPWHHHWGSSTPATNCFGTLCSTEVTGMVKSTACFCLVSPGCNEFKAMMCDTKAGFSSSHCSSCWNVILWWGIKKHKCDPRWWPGHADAVLFMVEPLIISGLMGCLESKSVIGFGVALPLACSPSRHVSTCTALGHLCYLCHQRTCGYVGYRLWGCGVGV